MTESGLGLPEGLSGERVQGLARLVGEICQRPVTGRPYLAPALLFADHVDHPELAMPETGPDELLIHDYQALEQSSELPLDEPLRAELQRKDGPASSEYRIDFGNTALTVALRKVSRGDIAGLKPTLFRNLDQMRDLGHAPKLVVTQDQIRQYLELSGDWNPIHHDPAYVHGLGLKDMIVPGMLLASLIQPYCPAGALKGLRARFMAPCFANDPVAVSIQSRGTARARAYIHSPEGAALALVDLQFQD